MLPGSTNILDQLLGGFVAKPTGASGAIGGTGATGVSAEGGSGPVFGDLLSLIANGIDGQVADNPTGLPIDPQFTDFMFPSDDQPTAQDRATAGPTENVESLLGMKAQLAGETIGIVAPTQPTLTDTEILGLPPVRPDYPIESVIENGIDIPKESPLNLLSGRATMQSLQVTTEVGLNGLANGSELDAAYRVLDSKVSQGQLELTVAADNKTTEPVKISIPTELLGQALADSDINVAKKSTLISRVPLGNAGQSQATPVDELLSKLNLKTLEIKTEPELTAAQTDSKPVKVVLVAENDGTQVAIKAKLKPQDVSVKIKGRQGKAAAPTRATNQAGSTDAQIVANADNAKPVIESNSPLRNLITPTEFDLADRLVSGTQKVGAETVQFSTFGSGKADAEMKSIDINRNLMPTVKLTLPDSIQKSMSSSGQTLILKIEPEHLGPARLNLTVRDQLLTARIIVDTPMAKMAVERSLEQLADQLSRAGIEIDKLEVMLSGGDARQQFFDRRSAWSHARKMNHHNIEMNAAAEATEASPLMHLPSNEYLETDRVNLLV